MKVNVYNNNLCSDLNNHRLSRSNTLDIDDLFSNLKKDSLRKCETQKYFYQLYKQLKSAYVNSKIYEAEKFRVFDLIWNNKLSQITNVSFAQNQLDSDSDQRRQILQQRQQAQKQQLQKQEDLNWTGEQGKSQFIGQTTLMAPIKHLIIVSQGPLTNHLARQQQMKNDIDAQNQIQKALKRFKNRDYFDSLRSFSKATSYFDIDELSLELQQEQNPLFILIVDCYLCSGYSYIKMDQQFEQVLTLTQSILDIQPQHLEPLFLRFLTYIKQKNFEKCHQIHDTLIQILRERGIFKKEEKQQNLAEVDDSFDQILNERSLRRLQSSSSVYDKFRVLDLESEDNEYFQNNKKIVTVSSNSTNLTDSTEDSNKDKATASKPQQVKSEKQASKNNQQKSIQSHCLVYLFISSFVLKGFNMRQIMGMLLYFTLVVYLRRVVKKVTKSIKSLLQQ
ncbi:UNKNOWN [Stylonychia lemnae]|uniref:Transmembrane protein n=1 Tax=Stylonychia lemnae TaxID=5949 RepID=A0A078A117_STYLE|nr:UNKNOWN [Stylonychia lemnae]|eukprot:CDW75911.1 UNKNOWN [Stylonychia lemnae]